MTPVQPWEHQNLHPTHKTASAPSPAGSLRGLLSRTLTRGRSSEHTPRRKQKSRPTSPVQDQQLATSLATASPRARSTSWSGQGPRKLSKEGKCRSTRTCSAKHPPPFAEAFRHAILHAKLETPVPAGDVKKNKSAANSPAIGVDVNASPLVVQGNSHAIPGDRHLASKIFILTDDGCLLQYRTDGASNRTPERILELGPQSTSVASDAIPGKHWVLSIVCNGRQDTMLPKSGPKPSRSRLFLRQTPELKRHARELLLVFSNDSTFNQWLICVRKEIEALGGLEYRPDSRGASELLQMGRSATRSEAVSTYNISPAESRRTSRFVNEGHDTDVKTMAQGGGIVSPRSTAGSSLGSTTELDRLRMSIVDARSLGSATVSTQADVRQEQNIPDINIMDPDEYRMSPAEVHTTTTTRRKKNLAPILVCPPSGTRSTAGDPGFPSPKFPRTPTLALDTVHSMAGAFGKPISPVTPTTPMHADQTPFSFMHGFDFTPYNGAELTPTFSNADDASFSSIQQTSRCSHSFDSLSPRHQIEFDSFAGDYRSVSTRDSREELPVGRASPPPAYTLAPRRKSSLEFRQKAGLDEPSMDTLVGLGITGHARSGSGLTPFVFPSRNRSQEMSLARIDASGLSPPDSIEELLMKEPTTPVLVESVSPRKMSRQKSMPNLATASGRPVAPPPSVPLPAVPYHASGTLSARRGRSISPPTGSSAQDLGSREGRSKTIDPHRAERVSPLASNPVSPAELTFARRLSIANGYPASETPPALPSPTQEVPVRTQKRSISKSPPPSTWDAWKAFPTLTCPKTTSRPDSGVFRAVTMPASVNQSPTPADDPVATVATRIDELLMMRHRSAASNDSSGRPAEGHGSAVGQEVDGDRSGAARQKTMDVNGFKFPMTL